MKNGDAGTLIQCHCPGLPGTEDPRIAKAVKAAEKDPVLGPELTRQRALDEQRIAAIEQLNLPPELLGRIAAGHQQGARPFAGKSAFLQPVVLAIVIGALVLLGWGGVTLYNRSTSFPGKDAVMRMVEINDDSSTPMEMVQISKPAGALDDWFFDKYGFEDYYLPPGFEKYQAVGARLYKQDDEPVGQVAVEDHNMIFFSFKTDNFGVVLPANDEWHVFTDGDWAAAVCKHDEEGFMVTFRGSRSEMEAFLATTKK